VQLEFDYLTFHVNCTPRVEKGQFVAQAIILRNPDPGERRGNVHYSGDLETFPLKEDAVIFAQTWAIKWCNESLM
jgi:hypothetical protein